jgi:hypothetical protein
MGSMSASDAAPLPRLGEVFFDVRGNSRSMRLSWYADTGVAVLSIWQGGMCTGTFRLAIADLPRMVETLQSGPGGQRPGWDAEAPGQVAGGPFEATAQVHTMGPPPFQTPPDPQAEQGDYRTGVREYLREPAGHRAAPGEYLAEPPDHRAGAPQYPAGLTDDPRTGPAPYRAGARDYLAEPADHRAGPAEYLAEPPDHRSGSAEYLTGPSGYPPRSPEQRTEYLADLPAAGSAGPAAYGGEFHPGSRSGASYPAPGDRGAYQRGTGQHGGYPGEPAGDPYLGGTGPLDYQDEPPMPYYPPGSSAPAHGDALGPSTADYPAHYGTAVTDDIGDERPADSFPYGRRPGNR